MNSKRLGKAAHNAAPVDEVVAMAALYRQHYEGYSVFHFYTPGPDYCRRFGKMIRYDKAELDQWIENNSILRNQKKAVKSVHINT